MDSLNNETLIRNIRLISDGKPIKLSDNEADEFIDTLISHNCQYLIWRMKLPLNNMKVLLYNAMIARNKSVIRERYRICEVLFHALEDNHISYAVYKGAILSASAYGEPYYRKSFDIDLLVKKENADEAKQILKDIGFIQGRLKNDDIVPYSRKELIFHSSMTHQTAPFIMQTSSKVCPLVNIDINFDVMWGESDTSVDVDYILGQTELIQIFDITVRKFVPVIDFIAVCLHHYKDANSVYQVYSGKLKLCLYVDIYYYLKNNFEKIPFGALAAVCEKLQVSKYIYYCLHHANLIFDDEIFTPYIRSLKTPDGEQLIDKYGLTEQERRAWNWEFDDRLLDKDFHQKFTAQLRSDDIQKIQFNSNMMQ